MTSTLSRTLRLVTLGLACIALALVVGPAPASAHAHLHAGDLEFSVGWAEEPPVVYQGNSIDIRVSRTLPNDTVELVEGVASNLTVTIATGPASAVKAVEPAFGRPGVYTFPIVPTRAGAYHLTIAGTIGNNTFNVTGEVEQVVSGIDVDFPVSDPTGQVLAQNDAELEDQIAAAQAELASARSQANAAYTVGIVGALAGLVGVGLGVTALRAARRKPPA